VSASRICLAAICATIALTSCGGGSGDGRDEAAVKGTVNGLYDAFAAKDARKVCASLTRARQREIESQARVGGRGRGSCARTLSFALAFLGDQLKRLKSAKVTDVRLDGDKATATVEYRGKKGDLGLSKQGGDWKVSDFEPPNLR
jgi:hypothetical protein